MFAVVKKITWNIPNDLMEKALEAGEELAREDFAEQCLEDGIDGVFDPAEQQELIRTCAQEWYRSYAELPKAVVFSFDGDRKALAEIPNITVTKMIAVKFPGQSIADSAGVFPATAKDKADYRAYESFHAMLHNAEFSKVLSLSSLHYSYYNTMSVYSFAAKNGRDPSRMIIRGYRAWEKEFNRVPRGKGIGIPIAIIHVPTLSPDPSLTDQDVEVWTRKQYKYLAQDKLDKKVEWALRKIHAGETVEAIPYYNEIYVYDAADTVVLDGKEDKLAKILNFDKVTWLDTPQLRDAVAKTVTQKFKEIGGTLSPGSVYEMLSAYADRCLQKADTIPKIGNPLPQTGIKHAIETQLAVGIISENEGFGLSDTINKELQMLFTKVSGDKQFVFEQMLRRAGALADQWNREFAPERKALGRETTVARESSEEELER